MKRLLPILLLFLAVVGAGIYFLTRTTGPGPVVGGSDEDGRAGHEAPALAKAPAGQTPKRPTGVDATMEGEDATSGAKPADGPFLTGTVLDDETGKPVSGARVVVREAREPCPAEPDELLFSTRELEASGEDRIEVLMSHGGGLRPNSALRGEVRTRKDGTFSIRWRLPKADVQARAPGFVIASACQVEAATPLTIRLRRGLTIEGFVLTADGKPIEGAALVVLAAPGVPREPGHFERASSDAEGRFAVTGLVPGPVVLSADHPRYMTQSLPAMEPGRKDVRLVLVPALLVSTTIRTEDAKAPDAPSLAWKTSGSPSREGLQLLDRAGEFDDTAVPLDSPEMPRAAPAAKPPEGVFSYLPLKVPCDRPDVGFIVKAIGCSPWVSERVPLPSEGGETKLEVSLVKDPTLGNLKVILEDRDRNPISFSTERCQVQMGRRDGKPVPAGVILKPGDALEVPALPAGPYTVIVRCPTHSPARSDVEVAAVRDTELRLTMGPPAKVHVRFRAPEAMIVKFRLTQGREVAQWFVEGPGSETPDDAEGTGERSLPAGTDGVILTGLATGRYTVEVVSPELVAPATAVDLTEGDTKDVEISVTRK